MQSLQARYRVTNRLKALGILLGVILWALTVGCIIASPALYAGAMAWNAASKTN